MVKSAPASTARLTQNDDGGRTGWVKGAGPVTYVDQFVFELEGARSAPSHP